MNQRLNIQELYEVSKYFKMENDFKTLIKLNPIFKQVLELFKYNLIDNTSLFPNITTQYFYIRSSVNNK